MHADPTRPSLTGVSHALVAYGVWGVAPVYWKLTAAFPARELLSYRVLASCAVALLLVSVARGWRDVWAVLSRPRAAAAALLAAALIATNWLVFIYAVQTDRILATSLGYYINPLLNVALGMLLLRERLNRVQGLAVALAAIGVLFQTWQLGSLPWISLALAASFGLYGLVRKTAPAPPLAGFCLETVLLSPLALAWLWWLSEHSEATLPGAGTGMQWLVAGSGLLTAVPLLAFASAARRLPLITLGLFQYLAPTLALLLAVTAYGEPFDLPRAVSFGCVWSALAISMWDSLQRRPRSRERQPVPAWPPRTAEDREA